MTTESLMIHAIKRGLLLSDFDELSVGMILDYIIQYDKVYDFDNNIKEAHQSDFNTF